LTDWRSVVYDGLYQGIGLKKNLVIRIKQKGVNKIMIAAGKRISVGICGGGPGGVALALCLGRMGCFQVSVLEKRENLGGGYKIDFRGKAVEAFQCMGIYEMIRNVRTDYKEAMVTIIGSHTVKMESDDLGARKGKDLEVMRGLFCRIVCGAAKETGNVTFRFEQSIQAISEYSNGVNVRLEDGEECQFDILVGADGIQSQVRELTFEQPTRTNSLQYQDFKYKLGVNLCYIQLPK
jgi:2-polyprenyl-6-methoxyphenol hydroxylase-like FAD-dependent oxidoreductase